MKAAVIGSGVIGGGWAARFLLNGWDVTVCDPDPQAERKVGAVLDHARRTLPALYDRALPEEGTLGFDTDLPRAVAGADWVQESVPERLDFKQAILGAITAAAPEAAVIASSTSGFKPSDLTARGARAIVAHPFNPVYLLPLVELVGASGDRDRAAGILRGIGMFPLAVRQEIDAHIADRLLEAMWREALWLVRDRVATTAEIDDAIRMGFGLRWAQMGLFETYRIAGGEAGMRHFLEQFGPALEWPWSRLTEVPPFDDALIDLIAAQSDEQSGAVPIRDLERRRDDNLVAMLRALKRGGSGAGGVIAAHEAALPRPALPVTAQQQVPPDWMDANGHMNISRYVELASNATEGFQHALGAGADYIAGGHSFFTAAQNIQYLAEVRAGARLRVSAQVLGVAARKVHLLFRIEDGARLAATVETVLVHVDLATRRACPIPPQVADRLPRLAADHADLPRPEGLALGF